MTTNATPWKTDVPHRENVDLATLTTMATPGVARWVATPSDEESLGRLLRELHEARVPFLMLGGGSNSIFTKMEFDPVVIRLGAGFNFIEEMEEPGRLRVGCATNLTGVLNHSTRHELAGFEWAVGIPGTIGGATVGNAGAAGLGIGDHVISVRGFTREGEPIEMGLDEIEFIYRGSNLRHLILTEVTLQLTPASGHREEIRARMAEHRARRVGQPYGDHSSGCIFRNPAGDAAGRLIDELGLKGFHIGEAGVSPDHANFLINEDRARPEDVIALIEHVRRVVHDQTGIDLETEVQLIDPDALGREPS